MHQTVFAYGLVEAARDVTSIVTSLVVVLAAGVAVVVLWRAWRASRRSQLVLRDLTNASGALELDATTPGLSELTRQSLLMQLRDAEERIREYYASLSGPDTAYTLELPPRPSDVSDRIDDEALTLARSVREVVPAKASSSFQLIADALFRPTGTVVSGMVLRRGDASADRIGIALDVASLPGSGVIRSPAFWEPATSGARPRQLYQERLLTLIEPAARWLAIELWAHGLRAAAGRTDRNRRLGLVANLAGGLFHGSALSYTEHAEVFTLVAIDRFREATRLLPWYYKPSENLAVACRDYAATPAGWVDAERWYRQAEKSYTAALAVVDKLGDSKQCAPLRKRLEVRRLLARLSSPSSHLQQQALQELAAAPPPLLPGEPARAHYTTACLYAVAARFSGGRADWEEEALALLGLALVGDQTERRDLWRHAPNDPDLSVLQPLDSYLKALRLAAPDPRPSEPYQALHVTRCVARQELARRAAPSPQ